MGCNCNMVHTILAVVIIVFAWWPGEEVSKWVLTIAGVLILLHAMKCKNCVVSGSSGANKAKKTTKRK